MNAASPTPGKRSSAQVWSPAARQNRALSSEWATGKRAPNEPTRSFARQRLSIPIISRLTGYDRNSIVNCLIRDNTLSSEQSLARSNLPRDRPGLSSLIRAKRGTAFLEGLETVHFDIAEYPSQTSDTSLMRGEELSAAIFGQGSNIDPDYTRKDGSNHTPIRHAKGDPELLKGHEAVNFRIAEQYLGIGERQRQKLMKGEKPALTVVGRGSNRRITVESLIQYCPPKKTRTEAN